MLQQRDGEGRRPHAVERFRLRRRVDRQERVREALLLDLGAIIFELHRQRRTEPELLRSKVAELTAVDHDLRELSGALGQGHELPELTARGLVATCTSCAGIMGIRDRHCPGCGAAAGMVTASDGAGPVGETVDLPALDPAELEAALPEGEAPVASRQTPEGEAPVASRQSPEGESPVASRQSPGEEAGDGHGFLPELDPVPEFVVAAGSFAPITEPVAAGSFAPAAEPAPAAGLGDEAMRPTPRRPGQTLIPKAQRTLRAGRRRARSWLAERRPEGP